MKWAEMSILTTQEAVEPISYILHQAGSGGVVVEDREDFLKQRSSEFGEIFALSADDYPQKGVLLKAYLQANSHLNETVEAIKQRVSGLTEFQIDISPNKVWLSEVDEEEWATAWKKYYKPVRVGSYITISPTWENYLPEAEEEIVVELDPGMAFGTGTHPTTVLCIQALEKYVSANDRLLDVGTGSGVLSIAAAKLGAAEIEAIDLDQVAVKSAEENVKINQVDSTVSVSQGNLLDHTTGTYDMIIANILAEVIVQMTKQAYEALRPGGRIITSGIISRKQETVSKSLSEAGFIIEETTALEDWVAIVAKRPETR